MTMNAWNKNKSSSFSGAGGVILSCGMMMLMLSVFIITNQVEGFSSYSGAFRRGTTIRQFGTTTTAATNLFAVQKAKNNQSRQQVSSSTTLNTQETNKEPVALKKAETSLLRFVWNKSFQSVAAATLFMSMGLATLLGSPDMAQAAGGGGSRIVGEISGSGLVFKDKLLVESFNDPKINGVTLYLTSFERPLTERLSKDFFSDPSASSLTCSKSSDKITVADNIVTSTSGEEVFEESKSLLFKQLRVRRIYDQQANTVVYVTYNTRLDKNDDSNKSRFKTSICSVSLLDSKGNAPQTAKAAEANDEAPVKTP